MSDITIPPEALRAARTAYLKATHLSWQGAVDAACHAMLAAWPGMRLAPAIPHSYPELGRPERIILPLPTENTNAEG